MLLALIANPKRLESFDSHLYKFLKSSNFPKSLIGNKNILNQLSENGETSKYVYKSFSENASTPIGEEDLKCIKRMRLNISVSHISMQKISGRFTYCLRSKWLMF